jgi:hypothetical protein
MRKNMQKRLLELRKALRKYCVICHFDYQIHLFDLWLNKYMSIGFAVLTFDNCEKERSLLSVFWQPQDRRFWLSICFINFR